MKIFFGETAPDNSWVTVDNRDNIDGLCDDNECTMIFGQSILDSIPFEKHAEFINHLYSKLRHGGRLILGGTDIVSLSLNIFNKTINVNDANKMIYGEGHSKKCGLTTLEEVRNIMSKILTVEKINIGISFCIEGKRE